MRWRAGTLGPPSRHTTDRDTIRDVFYAGLNPTQAIKHGDLQLEGTITTLRAVLACFARRSSVPDDTD